MRKKNIILIAINVAFVAILCGVLASCASAKSSPIAEPPSLMSHACLAPYPADKELSLIQLRELRRCLDQQNAPPVRWHHTQDSGGCRVWFVSGPDGRMVQCVQCSGGIVYCS